MRVAKVVITVFLLSLVLVDTAFAQEATVATGDLAKFAAAIGIAIAAFGGAIGQGKVAAAALEGVARNPGAAGQMTTYFFAGLALIESLVLFAFLIANGLTS